MPPKKTQPTHDEMLQTEMRDFYKRALLAALTGTARHARDVSARDLVENAAEIAALAVNACTVWKANQERTARAPGPRFALP